MLKNLFNNVIICHSELSSYFTNKIPVRAIPEDAVNLSQSQIPNRHPEEKTMTIQLRRKEIRGGGREED